MPNVMKTMSKKQKYGKTIGKWVRSVKDDSQREICQSYFSFFCEWGQNIKQNWLLKWFNQETESSVSCLSVYGHSLLKLKDDCKTDHSGQQLPVAESWLDSWMIEAMDEAEKLSVGGGDSHAQFMCLTPRGSKATAFASFTLFLKHFDGI